jgi:hypothetical protein
MRHRGLTTYGGAASLDGVLLRLALRYVEDHLYGHGDRPEAAVSSIPPAGYFEVSGPVPFAGVRAGGPGALSGALPHLLEVVL